jgi:hypothetical protein
VAGIDCLCGGHPYPSNARPSQGLRGRKEISIAAVIRRDLAGWTATATNRPEEVTMLRKSSTKIRNRLTYANLMSSIAVFLMLGGATAIAAKTVLPKNSVGTKQLKKNAVNGPKILDGSVTSAELADAAVTLAKLADNSVDGAKVVDGSVNTADLANAAVTLTKLAANSVDSTKVVDESLTAADLGNNSVNSAEIATDAVGETEIANNSIDGGEILNAGLSDVDVGNASGTFTFNAPSIAANQCTVQAPPVAGVDNNDHVIVSPSPEIMELNLSVTAGRSTSDGFIRLNLCNPTGAAIDPPNAIYSFVTINQ